MTEDEFFAVLRRSGRDWELAGERIRTKDLSLGTEKADCPITAAYLAVYDGSVDVDLVYWAGMRLGLDSELVRRLLLASDFNGSLICDLETFRIRVRLLSELIWE